MTPYLITLIVYLIGGYIMLALLAHYEAGSYSEWELLAWCLTWPALLGLTVLFFFAMLLGRGFEAGRKRQGRS